MQLELAIVETCAPTGARVRLLQNDQELDTLYSSQILHYQVEIHSGDLVVVDLADHGGGATRPRAVFCFARTRVVGVEISVQTDRHPGSLSSIEGLDAPIRPGDWVFATMGHVYDRCVDGMPADADRLWAEARPMVQSLIQPDVPALQPEPVVSTGTTPQIEYLTAQTERGRVALQTVMDCSYRAGCEGLPPEWTLVRVVDGVPVSYAVVNPGLELAMGSGSVPYAFVNDVATRTDRRREGHLRALMEHIYERLRRAGYALVLLHGRYPLYRPLGFEVFTHHCGIFITPEQIERVLGTNSGSESRGLLQVEDHRGIQPDLLVVADVQAGSLAECAAALRAAAALAREKAKARILFEHPPAPCGARYEPYPSPETAFTTLARTCGADVRLQVADPESGTIPDADWIKVLDAAVFVSQALACRPDGADPLPEAMLALDTDAGAVTITSRDGHVAAHEGIEPGALRLPWPSSALAQLVTGYRSAGTLALLHGLELPPEAQGLFSALFAPCWRFSRNESWTFKS